MIIKRVRYNFLRLFNCPTFAQRQIPPAKPHSTMPALKQLVHGPAMALSSWQGEKWTDLVAKNRQYAEFQLSNLPILWPGHVANRLRAQGPYIFPLARLSKSRSKRLPSWSSGTYTGHLCWSPQRLVELGFHPRWRRSFCHPGTSQCFSSRGSPNPTLGFIWIYHHLPPQTQS